MRPPRPQYSIAKGGNLALRPCFSVLVDGIGELLESSRRSSVRAVNAVMTATYWDIDRRIVEFEQGGEQLAEYGAKLIENLSADLTTRYGRGFSRQNLQRFRLFYSAFPPERIRSTVSSKSDGVGDQRIRPTVSGNLVRPSINELAGIFLLPWSHYVTLITGCTALAPHWRSRTN